MNFCIRPLQPKIQQHCAAKRGAGIEPTNKGLANLCLTTWLPPQWTRPVSNRQPPHCECGALPTELLARKPKSGRLEGLAPSTNALRPWPRNFVTASIKSQFYFAQQRNKIKRLFKNSHFPIRNRARYMPKVHLLFCRVP